MRAVNLLPREEPKKSRKRRSAPMITGLVAAVVVLAVLGGGFFLESAKVAHKQTDLDAARAELALVPAPTKPNPASATLAVEETQRVAAVQAALNGRVAWDRLLREISLVLPDDVWLSSLSLQLPAAALPTDPTATTTTPAPPSTTLAAPTTTFTMSGQAFSHEGVARLLTRLALIPELENVTLGNSARLAPGKRGAVQFSLTAGIRTLGGTS